MQVDCGVSQLALSDAFSVPRASRSRNLVRPLETTSRHHVNNAYSQSWPPLIREARLDELSTQEAKISGSGQLGYRRAGHLERHRERHAALVQPVQPVTCCYSIRLLPLRFATPQWHDIPRPAWRSRPVIRQDRPTASSHGNISVTGRCLHPASQRCLLLMASGSMLQGREEQWNHLQRDLRCERGQMVADCSRRSLWYLLGSNTLTVHHGRLTMPWKEEDRDVDLWWATTTHNLARNAWSAQSSIPRVGIHRSLLLLCMNRVPRCPCFASPRWRISGIPILPAAPIGELRAGFPELPVCLRQRWISLNRRAQCGYSVYWRFGRSLRLRNRITRDRKTG